MRRDSRRELAIGMGALLLCHILMVSIMALLNIAAGYATRLLSQLSILYLLPSIVVFGIGLTQIVYSLPLWLWFRRRGRVDAQKGVAIGVLITALLNGGCFVYLFIILLRNSF